jgi:hypothetical protein
MCRVKQSSGRLFNLDAVKQTPWLAVGSPLRSLLDGGPWGLRSWMTGSTSSRPNAVTHNSVPVVDADVAKGLTVSAAKATLVQRSTVRVPGVVLFRCVLPLCSLPRYHRLAVCSRPFLTPIFDRGSFRGGVRDSKLVIELSFLVSDPVFVYYLAYLLFAFLGDIVSPFFFCFHILDVVYRWAGLRTIATAVRLSFGRLSLTALLVVILIYLYTIIGFNYFRDTYQYVNRLGVEEYICDTLYSCFFYTLNRGVVSGTGIGGEMLLPSFKSEEPRFFGRLVFDFTFFALISVVLIYGGECVWCAQLRVAVGWKPIAGIPTMCVCVCPTCAHRRSCVRGHSRHVRDHAEEARGRGDGSAEPLLLVQHPPV